MAVLGCRPVELDPSDRLDAKILRLTFVYEGSVKRRCGDCGVEVWLGPRQQTLEAIADAIVCFRCSAGLVVEGNFETHHLGNPQEHPRG